MSENEVIKVKEPKIKKTVNKDTLVISIIAAIVVLLTAAIVVYYFFFANNETVIKYDGGKVTREEYEIYYTMIAPYFSYYGYSADQIKEYVNSQAVRDDVVYAKAVKAGYKLTDADKKEIDGYFTDKDEVKSIEEKGIDPEKLKQLYYNEAVISAYAEGLAKDVKAEDVKAYIIEQESEEGKTADLNIYNTSHILLKFKDGITTAEKAKLLAKANSLLAKAKAGSDFATLAKKNSDDSSASAGGVVSVKNNNTIYEEYMKAVLTLTAGKIYGKVVETTAGYHVIKLNSITKNGRLEDSEDRVSYVTGSVFYNLMKASNYKAVEDKLNVVVEKLNQTLGITTTDSTSNTAATAE